MLNTMKETVQIDQAGRMVLPKHLRERFGLQKGDTLAIEVRGDTIELRPTRSNIRLQRVNGVLVLAQGKVLPEGRDLVSESREERIAELVRGAKGPR
jgi:AbrB family looped-hinge helix DNA binding protein